MISAERVMAYSKLDPEASLETLPPHSPPPPDWPDKGSLSLEDVAFRYSDDMPLVLKNLSFSIKPSEKVIPRVSYASPPSTSHTLTSSPSPYTLTSSPSPYTLTSSPSPYTLTSHTLTSSPSPYTLTSFHISHTHILPISLHTHLPPHRWVSWVAQVPVSPPSSLCSSD